MIRFSIEICTACVFELKYFGHVGGGGGGGLAVLMLTFYSKDPSSYSLM